MNFLRNRKLQVYVFLAFLFSAFILVFSSNKAYAADGTLKVHYIDVGQADSILLELPNDEVMLIDGGTYDMGETVINYLEEQGITKIDYLINTHPHGDHVGGLISVVGGGNFEIENIYMTSAFQAVPRFIEFTELLDSMRIEPVITNAGDILIDETVNGKKLKVKCIGPLKLDDENFNNDSIVLRLEYGKTSYLFMGDAEEEEENDLLKSEEDLSCDVYKVGHHGSNTSTTQKFLNTVKPKSAVITADASENSSGLPAEAVLTRLEKSGADIYRTDLLGTIISTSNGESYSMNKTPKSEIYLPAGIITVSYEKCAYTGSPCTPAVKITIGGIELVNGVDYTCKYTSNVNVGTATITCTGKEHYYGVKTKTFKITKRSISNATYFHADDMVYTGSKLYPKVAVKDGSKTLVLNKDYKISYTKSFYVGEGIVTVKGMGNYNGSKKIYFIINPQKTKIISKKSLTNGKIMLQWKKISNADGYQIMYSVNDKNHFKVLKNVKGADITSITKKLSPGKQYYFKIRAYKTSDGKKYYSGESSVVGIKHKKSIAACKIKNVKNLKYKKGKAVKQKSVVVKLGSKKLKEYTDYVLKYKKNKKRGKAVLIVKGIGFYRSYAEKKFSIL